MNQAPVVQVKKLDRDDDAQRAYCCMTEVPTPWVNAFCLRRKVVERLSAGAGLPHHFVAVARSGPRALVSASTACFQTTLNLTVFVAGLKIREASELILYSTVVHCRKIEAALTTIVRV